MLEEHPAGNVLAQRHAGRPERDGIVPSAKRTRANRDQRRGQPGDRRLFRRLAGPHEMACGNVPGLMGNHAHEGIRGSGTDNQARVEENVLAARHECVDRRLVHEIQIDRACIQAGGRKDGIRPRAHVRFDFRIPNQWDPLRRHRRDGGRDDYACGKERRSQPPGARGR